MPTNWEALKKAFSEIPGADAAKSGLAFLQDHTNPPMISPDGQDADEESGPALGSAAGAKVAQNAPAQMSGLAANMSAVGTPMGLPTQLPLGTPIAQEPDTSPGAVVGAQAADPRTQTPAPARGAPTSSGDMNPGATVGGDTGKGTPQEQLRAALEEKYGLNKLGTPALMQAMQDSAHGQASAMKAQAAATIGAAFTRGATKVNPEFYDKLAAQAKEAPGQVEMLRKSQTENMQNDAALDKLTQEKMDSDPNSSGNKSFRQMLSQALHRPESEFMGVTLANPGPFEKMAGVIATLEGHKIAKAQLAQQKEAMFAQSAQHSMQQALKSVDDQDAELKHVRDMANKATVNSQSANELYGALQPLLTGSKRLSPEWVKHASGDKQFMEQMNQALTGKLTGTLTKHNADLVKDMLNDVEKTNNQIRSQHEDRATAQLSALIHKSPDESRTYLGLGSTKNAGSPPPPAAAGTNPQHQPGDTIRVKGKTYTLAPDGNSLIPQ